MQLITWNTQWCCGLDGVVSPQRIAQQARALADFDVLCLQEIAVHYPGLPGNAGQDQAALLRDLLPGYQVFFGAAVDEWNPLGGCRTWSVDSENGPQRGQFLPDLQPHSAAMGQKDGEKWTAAAHLQPTISKSDSLLCQRQQFGNLIATRLPVLQLQHYPLPYPADAGVSTMPRMCSVATLRDPALGAVRVMTTHLEYYSKRQRMAQAQALRALHAQACALAAAPPEACNDSSPFQTKTHTPHAVLCGDFNFEPHEPEHAAICAPAGDGDEAPPGTPLWDSWRLLHGEAPQPPTFRLYDHTYGPQPCSCDFVFVSDSLKGRVQRFAVDAATQASDHQPVVVLIG